MIPSEDGIYPNISDTLYHSDRSSLSSSGARKLLPPSCPAIFRWEQLHGRKPKAEYDFGHAAHKFVLGEGEEIAPIYADDWRTKAAKEQRDQARADGKVPLLKSAVDTAMEMANKVMAHPLAAALLAEGTPELSGFHVDAESGVRLRFRPDWITELGSGRVVVADYKTTTSAHPSSFAKHAAEYGYHMQQAWYLDGLAALEIADDAVFLFIAQEKTPPYLVSVIELDAADVELGRRLNRHAIDLYGECTDSGEWPGYGQHIHHVSLPSYAVTQQERHLQ